MVARIAQHSFRMLCLALVISVGPGTAGRASPDPAALCEDAARRAAARHDIPPEVLRAISLVESGRASDGRLRPWPWTINVAGKGVWFDDRAAALKAAQDALADGQTSFDTGCFQINYRWHGDAFASLEQMFDPDETARYAARFLAGLYREKGDWTLAAGAYHSRTESRAAIYRAKVARHLDMPQEPPSPTRTAAPTRQPQAQTTPETPAALIAATAPGRLGSLLPRTSGPHLPGLFDTQP